MSDRLKLYGTEFHTSFINLRREEAKLGQKISKLDAAKELEEILSETKAKFILFGIPEDAGIAANRGRIGSARTWQYVYRALLNQQHNAYFKGKKLCILGELDFSREMERLRISAIDKPIYYQLASEITEEIDKEVTHISRLIVAAGKIPIAVGGGHNNAYGLAKGTALAYAKQINVFNIDAHADLRVPDGRHSGNAFTYLFEEGFLRKYMVFGLHEGYVPRAMLKRMKANHKTIQYKTYEQLFLYHHSKSWEHELDHALDFISDGLFGLEMDMDSIANFPSSAKSPAGFSLDQARYMIHHIAQNRNVSYLHLCEAAPNENLPDEGLLVGKALAYLIMDFMKAVMSQEEEAL